MNFADGVSLFGFPTLCVGVSQGFEFQRLRKLPIQIDADTHVVKPSDFPRRTAKRIDAVFTCRKTSDADSQIVRPSS